MKREEGSGLYLILHIINLIALLCEIVSREYGVVVRSMNQSADKFDQSIT